MHFFHCLLESKKLDLIPIRNVKSSTLQLSTLYLNPSISDVTFVIESNGTSAAKIPAHKCILATCSPVFERMFSGYLPALSEIRLNDITPAVFKEFIKYFYLDEVNLTFENVAEVVYLARKYEMIDYMAACSKFIQMNLSLDRMCEGLELAVKCDFPELIAFCELEIFHNSTKFFASKEFLTCDRYVLKSICIRLELLKFIGEEVFVGVLRWARSAWKRENCLGTEPTLADVRNRIDDLVYCIEFSSMSNQALTSMALEMAEFFKKEELLRILKIVATKYPHQECNGSTSCEMLLNCPTISLSTDVKWHYINQFEVTEFESTKKIILLGYRRAKIFINFISEPQLALVIFVKKEPLEDMVLYRNLHNLYSPVYSENVETTHDTIIGTIVIEPNVKYLISVQIPNYKNNAYFTAPFTVAANNLKLGDNDEITIQRHGIISQLHFKIPE